MFQNTRLDIGIYAVSAIVFVGAFAAIRAQTFVGDAQLSRSLIPHHSVAIKTCEQATLEDPETIALCDQIVQAQREEIAPDPRNPGTTRRLISGRERGIRSRPGLPSTTASVPCEAQNA